MYYTTITDIIWASQEDQYATNDANFNDKRNSYIDTKISENKTDGIGYEISNTQTRRLWVDRVSAQDYIDFITSLASTHNLNIVQANILDNV